MKKIRRKIKKVSEPIKKRKVKNEALDNSSIKKGLEEINKVQNEYDKLFETKLRDHYRDFRAMKDTAHAAKKFLRIVLIILVIVMVALLAMSF
jgi:hypothetical protein